MSVPYRSPEKVLRVEGGRWPQSAEPLARCLCVTVRRNEVLRKWGAAGSLESPQQLNLCMCERNIWSISAVVLSNLCIQFILYRPISQILNFPQRLFTICTHTTSLTFDLTSDQDKLPRNRRKKSEETFRRATEEDPSPGWTEEKMSCDQKESLHSYINTFNECMNSW